MASSGIWPKVKIALRRWEFWVAILGVAITLFLAIFIALNKDIVQQLSGYGYLGLIIISALGGATVLIPVPMLAIQFAMGGVLAPWFGPLVVGPLFVGLVAGLGETIGALTIYMTGYGGGTPLAKGMGGEGRLQRIYHRLITLMRKRGKLTLFLISAIINPFFYPVSLAAGALHFGVWRYFLIAFAGKTIKTTAIAYAGYFGLRGIFEVFGISL